MPLSIRCPWAKLYLRTEFSQKFFGQGVQENWQTGSDLLPIDELALYRE